MGHNRPVADPARPDFQWRLVTLDRAPFFLVRLKPNTTGFVQRLI